MKLHVSMMIGYDPPVRWSRVYLWAILSTVVAAIVLFLVQISNAVYFRQIGELLAACAMAFGFAVLGLACAAACENGKSPMFMRSGMIAGAIALACWVALLFVPMLQMSARTSMWPLRVFIWPTVWAALMAFVGMLLLLPMYSGWRWGLRAFTILLLGAFALFIAAAYAFYPDVTYTQANGGWDESAWQRRMDYARVVEPIGAAMSILSAGAVGVTLIVGLIGALTGRTAAAATSTPTPYWLTCPRCGCEQEARTGEHACVSCKLRTRIDFA